MNGDYQDKTKLEKEVTSLVDAYGMACFIGKEVSDNVYKKLVAMVGEDRAKKLVGGRR